MHSPRNTLSIVFLCFSSLALGQIKSDTSSNATDSAIKTTTAKPAKPLKIRDPKYIVPPADKAVVYIVRPTIMGFAVPMRVDCDSFQVGWINAKTFLYTILDPGPHTFKCLAENEFHLDVNLEGGKVYYYEEQVKMGFAYARTKLKPLNVEEGQKRLDKCSISGSN